MKKRNQNIISPFLKNSYASAVIIGAFILGLIIISIVVFGADNWQFNSQHIPNIMPVLMAIISFFAVGYSVMCVVTSRFFQSMTVKRPNYSHLEF